MKVIAAFLFLALPSPVGAQASFMNRPADVPLGNKVGDVAKRRIMFQFAACTTKLHERKTAQYLKTAPGSAEAKRYASELAVRDCLANGRIGLQEAAFRAAAYEAMYRRKFEKSGPTDFSSVAPIDYLQTGTGVDRQRAVYESEIRKLADCATRKNGVKARRLILSPIGSAEETEALSAFKPYLSGCLTTDVKLRFSHFALKGMIAEALFRLSNVK